MDHARLFLDTGSFDDANKMNINKKQFKFPLSKSPEGSKIHFEYVWGLRLLLAKRVIQKLISVKKLCDCDFFHCVFVSVHFLFGPENSYFTISYSCHSCLSVISLRWSSVLLLCFEVAKAIGSAGPLLKTKL